MTKTQLLTTWNAMPGFLLLTPVRLPDKTESGILLPDTVTLKANSGLCVAVGVYPDGVPAEVEVALLGKEIFFNRHDEYQLVDSDSGTLFYILHHTKVIMWRVPSKSSKFFQIPTPASMQFSPLTKD